MQCLGVLVLVSFIESELFGRFKLEKSSPTARTMCTGTSHGARAMWDIGQDAVWTLQEAPVREPQHRHRNWEQGHVIYSTRLFTIQKAAPGFGGINTQFLMMDFQQTMQLESCKSQGWIYKFMTLDRHSNNPSCDENCTFGIGSSRF